MFQITRVKRSFGFQRKGTALPSFCSTILEEKGAQDAQGDLDLRWTANSMYSGAWTGSDHGTHL